MRNRSLFILAAIAMQFLTACNNNSDVVKYTEGNQPLLPVLPADKKAFEPGNAWEKHWQDGKAEISTYVLHQSRYGALRSGTLTNIFVTEDFAKLKQVKLDDPGAAGKDKLPVLKLNQSLKFVTGIYPYSLMLSVFSPLDIYNYPHAVKITATAQEWCGQAFYQLNNRNNRLLVEQHSYFETEGDQQVSLEPVMLEDEWWNLIKIAPEKLPQGQQKVLPGALYTRLSHKPIQPVAASLSLVLNDSLYTYTADFTSLERRLVITFEKQFPYRILKWEDTFPGTDGKPLTTTATLLKTTRLDYWKKNQPADTAWRTAFGLPASTQ